MDATCLYPLVPGAPGFPVTKSCDDPGSPITGTGFESVIGIGIGLSFSGKPAPDTGVNDETLFDKEMPDCITEELDDITAPLDDAIDKFGDATDTFGGIFLLGTTIDDMMLFPWAFETEIRFLDVAPGVEMIWNVV